MSTDNLNPYPGNLKQHKVDGEPKRAVILTHKEWSALRAIVNNGWSDGEYAGYGGQHEQTQYRAMKKLDEAHIATNTEAELQRLRGLLDEALEALDGIASMSRDGSKGRVQASHAKLALGMMAGIAEDALSKLKK